MAVGEAAMDTKSAQGNSEDTQSSGSTERVEKENAEVALGSIIF